jgi:hypothetical protein
MELVMESLSAVASSWAMLLRQEPDFVFRSGVGCLMAWLDISELRIMGVGRTTVVSGSTLAVRSGTVGAGSAIEVVEIVSDVVLLVASSRLEPGCGWGC